MFNHRQVAKQLKDASDLSNKRQKAAEARIAAVAAENDAEQVSKGAWEDLHDVLKTIVASDPVARDSSLGRALGK